MWIYLLCEFEYKFNLVGDAMKRLIVLRGNSGSGKTTIAKEIQKRLGNNTMLISQDVIRRDMLKVKDGENNQAIPLMKELLIYGRNNCDVVILEGIMYSTWYSSLFDLANNLYGASIYAYYFDLPFDETLRRHKTKPNCQEFGEEAMREWWCEKDYSNALHENTITKEKTIEEVVNGILYRMEK